jgi:hypothetical protein
MRRPATIIVVMLLLGLRARAGADPINAIIGDISAPTAIADDTTRIRTHLTYVLELLRAADTTKLSPPQRAHRQAALASLASYIERGSFPRRTSDIYDGRRPRFIDDRGVPCAVAYLLLASGATELAHAIDAQHEYAYILDIEVPALAEWADDHGLSRLELAMIQPRYGPRHIDERRMRSLLEDRKDSLVLQCAREGAPLETIELHLVGDDKGPKSAKATQRGAFAECIERSLGTRMRGDPRHGLIATPFDFTVTLTLDSPQKQLETQLGYFGTRCMPKPGPIPKTATIDFSTTATVQSLSVVTSPANTEVAMCIASEQLQALQPFNGIAGLSARKTVTVPPRFDAKKFEHEVQMNAYGIARNCQPKEAIPRKVTVTVTGKTDDVDLVIKVDTKHEAFASCIKKHLREHLHVMFSGHIERADHTYEKYFRIDADVSASHSFELPPPEK